MRRTALFLGGIFLLVLAALEYHGLSSRNIAKTAHVEVTSPAEAFYGIRNAGLKGTTLVLFSAHSFFSVRNAESLVAESAGFIQRKINIADECEKKLSDENFLWVSMEKKLVRKIIRVLPDTLFQERLRNAGKYRELFVKGDRIEAPFFGSPRTLVTAGSLPSLSEPVVIFADPSFFRDMSPNETVRQIRTKLDPAVVIYSRMDYDKTVSDEERGRLDEFVDLIEGECEKNTD